MTDFLIRNEGTVVLFIPVSDAAREFALSDELGLEDWQRFGEHFAIDHRPAVELVNQLFYEGWDIA
tara:strand:- start:619 stop:816 length:198 start_codon:yes stop_codon:yes gene_type:complete